jgi:hypothetical protein
LAKFAAAVKIRELPYFVTDADLPCVLIAGYSSYGVTAADMWIRRLSVKLASAIRP